MSDPVSDLKRELLAAAERQQHAVPARKSRLRWLERPDGRRGGRRRRVLAVAAAALVVVVGTASAIGGVRAYILDRGFIGLPPVGATPSTPESGELVLRWLGRSETLRGRPLVRVWVYADGRILWSHTASLSGPTIAEGANELTSGYLEQRLTPEGVELMRSEVIGLLEGSRTPLETVPAEDDPRWHAFGVEARDGDRLVRPREPDDPTEVIGRDGERWATTPEQLAALQKIDALVTDTASVLPASAWAVRAIRAYVPSHYEVCIRTSPPKDASELLSLLPTRAADVLRDKSRTGLEADVVGNTREDERMRVLGRAVSYCSKLTTDEAREVAEGLAGLDRSLGYESRVRLAYRLAEGAHQWEGAGIWFEPYLPHGQVPCSACG